MLLFFVTSRDNSSPSWIIEPEDHRPDKAFRMRCNTVAIKNSNSRQPELFHIRLLFEDNWMIDNIHMFKIKQSDTK